MPDDHESDLSLDGSIVRGIKCQSWWNFSGVIAETNKVAATSNEINHPAFRRLMISWPSG
jgi:hypothetical protein